MPAMTPQVTRNAAITKGLHDVAACRHNCAIMIEQRKEPW